MKRIVLISVLFSFVFLSHAQIWKVPEGHETRWTSFENPTGAKGTAAQANKGAKGSAFGRIMAGDSCVLLSQQGPGIINRIWLTVSKRNPKMLRALRIKFYWDNSVVPAVDVPLGDFFGNPLSRTSRFENCFFSNPEKRSFNCCIPMPYRTGAKVVKGDLLGIRSFVLNGSFDVVIIECGQAMTTDALLPIMSQIKVPCILHAHGLSGLLCKPFGLKSDFKHTIGGTYNWLRMQIYYGYTFKRQCKYFAASISLTDCDSGFDYVTKNIQSNYVLCNAADDAFFEKAEEQYELPTDGRPYLISIANYTVVKNQIEMMRQFYKSKHKEYALVMIGSKKTPYYYELQKAKAKFDRQYGERSVFMFTGIDRKYFPYILDKASAYLVSSTHEEFSISVIEAMARSLPFISTNVGNAHQLPGGIVVDDIRDMHLTIDAMLGNDKERARLGKEGKQYAFENCRRRTAVKKMESIIHKVLQQQVKSNKY